MPDPASLNSAGSTRAVRVYVSRASHALNDGPDRLGTEGSAMSDKTPGQRILSDLAANGGGTYDAVSLVPFTPSDGFAVGVGGLTLHMPAVTVAEAGDIEGIMRDLGAGMSVSYVGTWLQGETLHLDGVVYFPEDDRQGAARCAIMMSQRAFYGFAEGKDIPTYSEQWDS